jgi:hypothetical protein
MHVHNVSIERYRNRISCQTGCRFRRAELRDGRARSILEWMWSLVLMATFPRQRVRFHSSRITCVSSCSITPVRCGVFFFAHKSVVIGSAFPTAPRVKADESKDVKFQKASTFYPCQCSTTSPAEHASILDSMNLRSHESKIDSSSRSRLGQQILRSTSPVIRQRMKPLPKHRTVCTSIE